ncbi:MFS transporter [Streptomyces sp. NPDC005322]|uniref:MFS transporter n=1 Tax=Streptomyces sp. NPDC005322 TaxID=3157032 RepID=UPI0033AE405B
MTSSLLSWIPTPRSPERGERSPWRCLRHRGMRWWSAANLVSNIGTWMQLTVQNLLVLHITGSAAATGLSLSVQAAPGLLLGVLGGAAVDAWPRKVTAVVSQAALGLVAFTTAALVAFDLLNMVSLMALAAVTGLIATVDAPACSLLGNDLVPTKDVPSAIALGSVVHSAGRLIGVALAGVAVATLGTASAYAANGLSFLFVAAVIPFLKPVARDGLVLRSGAAPRAPDPQERRPDVGAREGLAYFLRRPRLVGLMVITAVSAVFGRNYQLTLAVLVTGPLAGSSEQFGTVATVLAVGGIAGAVLAGRMQRPSVRWVGALAATGALLQVAAGFSAGLIMLLVLVAPMAIVESVSDTVGTTVLQTDPPPGMRGRVLGVWSTAQTAWGLAGPPLLGLLMEWAGVRGALVAGGLIIAGVIGVGWLLHGRRAGSRPVTVESVAPAQPAAAGIPAQRAPVGEPATA